MATKPNKTHATALSGQDFLAGVSPEPKRADASALCDLMSRLAGEPPKMWGPSIVGFGVNHYKYESGREGEICRIGFSPRKEALVLYGMGVQDNPLLDGLGKYTIGKGCLYIKCLSDVDASALEAIIARAWNRPTESAG